MSWEGITKLGNDAMYNFKRYDYAAIKNSKRHRQLGIFVVIITAIVGSAVFGALIKKDLPFEIQLATGFLSILATVLSAVQTFYSFESNATKMKAASVEFY